MPNLKLKCLDDSITYLLTSQVLPRFWSQWDIFPLNFRTVFFLNWVNGPLDSWSFNKFVQVWWKPFKKKKLHFYVWKKEKKKTEHKYVI